MSHGDAGHDRLDGFVDAAFAFALTLLVAGNIGDGAGLVERLRGTVAGLPALAFGFAVTAMFWHEHVSWRRLAGNGHWTGVVLSLALVFVVMSFVVALAPMAQSVAAYFLGGPPPVRNAADLPLLFRLYGAGFATMAALVMLLFLQGVRHGDAAKRPVARGRAIIYGVIASCALLSMLLTGWRATTWFAPWAYALIGPAVGLFAWRHDWAGEQA